MEESDFSWALRNLKNGNKICRSGWNGKGMWLKYVGRWSIIVPSYDGNTKEADMNHLPFIMMKTAQDELVPWLASQTDILAMDWELANE